MQNLVLNRNWLSWEELCQSFKHAPHIGCDRRIPSSSLVASQFSSSVKWCCRTLVKNVAWWRRSAAQQRLRTAWRAAGQLLWCTFVASGEQLLGVCVRLVKDLKTHLNLIHPPCFNTVPAQEKSSSIWLKRSELWTSYKLHQVFEFTHARVGVKLVGVGVKLTTHTRATHL